MTKPQRNLQLLVASLVSLSLAHSAFAKVQTKDIEYKHGDATLKGHLAWDDSISGKRPGVLVVHEWWGLNDYARKRADMLAQMGYVAFAADMYGDGKTTEHPMEAKAWATTIRQNQKSWQERAQEGLKILLAQEQTDGSHIGAIGYCFGGSTVLQLAYAGADLDAVVTFHGALPTPSADDAENIKAKILVCQGAADTFIPETQVLPFRAALENANVDWQMVYYAQAQHSFTVPTVDARNLPGMKYNKHADERSWQQMEDLFKEAFGK